MSPRPSAVSVLGLGAMGRALASVLLPAGHPVSVWNRSPGRAETLIGAGATEVSSVREAILASPVVIVCVRDYPSARDLLEPEVSALGGRTVVDLTTGTPDDARAMAAWASERGIGYLDGGIMATPDLIGGSYALLLYSGSSAVFDEYADVLRLFGSARFMGEDAGMASLVDLALLASMYTMFVGVYQAAAMVASAGMRATDFADLAVPWLEAMAGSVREHARTIDNGDYETDVQDLRFTKAAFDAIVTASEGQGVGTEVLQPLGSLIDRQIDAGHGDELFTRIYEGVRAAD